LLRRTTVFGMYDGAGRSGDKPGTHTFGAVERVGDHIAIPTEPGPRQRLWRIIARRTILASGATERPIVFCGNDRPGVMMASAARSYVNRFGVAPAQHAALFTTTDSGWTTAFDLAAAGITTEVIVDPRPSAPALLVNRAARLGIRTCLGAQVTATKGWSG